MKNIEELKKNNDIYLVVVVDLKTGEEKHFKDAGIFEDMDREWAGLDFFERTRLYQEEVLDQNDRKIFENTLSLEKIKESISNGETISCRYNAAFNGFKYILETSYSPAGETDKAIKSVRCIRKEV